MPGRGHRQRLPSPAPRIADKLQRKLGQPREYLQEYLNTGHFARLDQLTWELLEECRLVGYRILDHNGNTGSKVRRIRAACNEKEGMRDVHRAI